MGLSTPTPASSHEVGGDRGGACRHSPLRPLPLCPRRRTGSERPHRTAGRCRRARSGWDSAGGLATWSSMDGHAAEVSVTGCKVGVRLADVLRAADAGPWSVAPADSTHRPSTRCPGGGAATFSSLFHVFRPLQRQLSRPTARGLGPVESAPPGGLRNGRDVAWRSPLPTHAVLYSGHHNKAPPSHPACFLARKRAHGRERPVSPPPPRLLPPPLPAVRTPGQEQGPSALTRRTRRLRGCPPLAVPGGGQHTPLPVFAAGHIPLLLRTVAPRLLSPPVVTPRSHPYSCLASQSSLR